MRSRLLAPCCLAFFAGYMFAFSSAAQSATLMTGGLTQADVQNAVDAAADGDTVQLPEGTATWTASVTVTGKFITIQGAGIDKTTIVGGDYAPSSIRPTHRVFEITAKPGGLTRLTGLTIDGGTGAKDAYNKGMIAFGGDSTTWRVDHPNIVIFHCHDLGQYLHCYGVKTVCTPNFDKFAEQGVRFARSFCTQPGCSASRASLFTGRYPHSNGVMGLTHANFAWDLRPEEKHLAQFLKEAGYATVAVGVVHETRSGAQRCGYEKHIKQAKAAEGTTAAIAELRRLAAAKRPFFLYAGFIEPHRLPYPKDAGPLAGEHGFPGPHLQSDDSLGIDVPGYLRGTEGTRQELAGLQGAVKHVDEQFGRWLQTLHELELESNTLVIATTDHGIAMPRAKCSVYEPGLQVALLLRQPGRPGWHGGVVRKEMVSNIDVLPTILELVGIPIPANVQGRSFAPLLDDRPYTPNVAIFGELTYHGYYDPQRSIRTETHKLIANFSTAPSFQDPSQQWRPRSDPAMPEAPAATFHPHLELYDLVHDPWEQVNLVDKPEHAAVRRELARRLHQHMAETDDPLLRGAVTPPQHETTLRLLQGEPAAKTGG